MIRPDFFIETLRKGGINCFAGVPDSLLKNVCAYMTDHLDGTQHVITANEGAAIGLAAGHYLATAEPACVYMQNSGEGNVINPLASLTDREVYDIPVLLLIGWRGRPGVKDEPQHVKQGKVTTGLLNVMGVNYEVLSKEEEKAGKQIGMAIAALRRGEAYALVIEKDTFGDYELQAVEGNDLTMSREEAIQRVAAAIGERDCIVSTTGMISRELFEYRTARGEGHERDFLTVGSMGHASQIALGIALARPERRVWCFDGDGAAIMHMGSMAIVANKAQGNFIHVVFNNGAHDSVGGQPTVGLKIDLPAVARAVGYKAAVSVADKESLERALKAVAGAGTARNPAVEPPDTLSDTGGAMLIEVRVRKGNRKDLGRPTTTPIENKEALMAFLNRSV